MKIHRTIYEIEACEVEISIQADTTLSNDELTILLRAELEKQLEAQMPDLNAQEVARTAKEEGYLIIRGATLNQKFAWQMIRQMRD